MPVAADIVKIDYPSSANAGDTVIIDVSVKNISSSDQNISVIAVFDSTSIPFQFDYLLVSPGQTVIMRGWFTMPSKSVTVQAWSRYWGDATWNIDDYIACVISLVAPPVQTYHLDVVVPSWATGGYVSPGSGDYPRNTTVTLTASPLSGYKFTGWGGDASGTNPTYNLYMNSDKHVEAYFEPVTAPPTTPEFSGFTVSDYSKI